MSEYVGFDVSKEETSFCVKAACGRVLARGKTLTSPEALFHVLQEHCLCPKRVVMETGTWGHWLVRGRGRLGVEADLIDARQAHAVMKLQHNKTDANDAELLAEIARTGFCRPVSVKSEAAQSASKAVMKPTSPLADGLLQQPARAGFQSQGNKGTCSAWRRCRFRRKHETLPEILDFNAVPLAVRKKTGTPEAH